MSSSGNAAVALSNSARGWRCPWATVCGCILWAREPYRPCAAGALPELAGTALSSRDCRRLHSLGAGAVSSLCSRRIAGGYAGAAAQWSHEQSWRERRCPRATVGGHIVWARERVIPGRHVQQSHWRECAGAAAQWSHEQSWRERRCPWAAGAAGSLTERARVVLSLGDGRRLHSLGAGAVSSLRGGRIAGVGRNGVVLGRQAQRAHWRGCRSCASSRCVAAIRH